MEFNAAAVKSIKANLASKEISITFSIALNDENMLAAEILAVYTEKNAGKVDVTIGRRWSPLLK